MFDVIWKCMLTGLVIGGVVGYFEAQGNKEAKEVNDAIEGAMTDIFAPPRKVALTPSSQA